MIFDEYRNPRPAGVTAPPTAPVAPPAAKRSARGVGGVGPNFLSPVPQAPQILLNQTNPTNAAMVANGQNPFHPIPNVNAPAFTTSPGAAPRTNGVPFVMPPEPIAATTSPGAAPPAAPQAAPRAAAAPYSGDPMNPSVQRVLPNTVETPPKPITGGPTIPGTATAQPTVARGTGFTVAPPPVAPSIGQRAMGAVKASAGPGMILASAIPEQLNVGKVLANPNADGVDVANQQVQSGTRMLSAGLGAVAGGTMGAATGPLAPVLAPLGAIAGGAYGYYAADKAIEGGRNLAGVDPRAPVDRLPAAAAEAPQPPVAPAVAPTATAARPNSMGQGYDDPRRVDRDPSRASLGVSRDFTNELNAVPQNLPGDLRKGAIYKTVDPKTGQPTYSGIDVAANAQMVDGKGATTAQRGGVTTLDMSEGRAQVQRELARIDADKAKEATRMDEQELAAQMQAGNTTAARAIRGRMKRQAEKTAADTTAATTGETQKLARDKFNLDAQGAALDNKSKARLGVLQDAVFNAKTPKDQAAAEDKLRAFQGKYEKQATDEYAYAPGGQEVDPATGTTVTRPGVIFNKRTGAIAPGQAGAKAAPEFVPNKVYVDAKGNRAKWDGKQFVPA